MYVVFPVAVTQKSLPRVREKLHELDGKPYDFRCI